MDYTKEVVKDTSDVVKETTKAITEGVAQGITQGIAQTMDIVTDTAGLAYETVQNKKLQYSAIGALVFLAVSLPQTYQLTSNTTGLTLFDGSCPTPSGKFLHTAVFLAVLYTIMKLTNRAGLTDGMMFKYAFYSALIFFTISSTEAYALTSGSMDGLVNVAGCPTRRGVLVHSVVFLFVLLLVMYLPECQYA